MAKDSAWDHIQKELQEGETIEAICIRPREWKNGKVANLMSLAEAEGVLKERYLDGYVGDKTLPECDFYAWTTKDRVIIVASGYWLESIPRNPVACSPQSIGR